MYYSRTVPIENGKYHGSHVRVQLRFRIGRTSSYTIKTWLLCSIEISDWPYVKLYDNNLALVLSLAANCSRRSFPCYGAPTTKHLRSFSADFF